MYSLNRVRQVLVERRPGHTLPRPLYADPEMFAFDLDAIWHRKWIFAGVEAAIRAPGEWFTLDIAETSVIVLRDHDGDVRAFFNACRHRGSRICTAERGRSARLICPYHQWAYDLDGALASARMMPADFNNAEYGLRPVHVELLGGTIYVCLADNPPDFSAMRAALGPLMAPHELADAKVATISTIIERGNWKLVMENARECYHCAVRHRDLVSVFRDFVDPKDPDVVAHGERMRAMGLDCGPVRGETYRAIRLPLGQGAQTTSTDGKFIGPKTLGRLADRDIGSLRWQSYPNTFNHAFGDSALMVRFLPIGPQETQVTTFFLVPADAEEGRDYDVGHLANVWLKTNDEDRELVETNQRGVNGLGYVPGPYSLDGERGTAEFIDWYCETANRHVAPAARAAAE